MTLLVVAENHAKNESRRSGISMFMTVHRLCGRHRLWCYHVYVYMYMYTLSQKTRANFETVYLEIIRIDVDDIWKKYSKYSRIEFVRFSFCVGLLCYQLFVFQTGHRK